MRLCDTVVQSARPVSVTHPELGTLRLPGAERFAPQLSDLDLRYVLSDDVARACGDMVLYQTDLLSDCLDVTRLPATRFWLEWHNWAFADRATGDRQKAGILIEADEGGRSGRLQSFWSSEFDVDTAPLSLYFDFDRMVTMPVDCPPEMHEIMTHCRFDYDPDWALYYQHVTADAQDFAEMLKNTQLAPVKDLMILLAFLLFLSVKEAATMKRSDLGKLNRARAKRGVQPLLDHIEVGTSIFRSLRSDRDMPHDSARRTSRLHHVRGHFFRKHDKLYWRRPHLRGDVSSGAPLTRVATVRLR